ncbi:beta-1,6-N-acetylglucosaminyltransferase [Leptolyngbyaceae cyanobacterium UHCC 1019]
MKICYLIQTHRCQEQIYRLVHTMNRLSPDAYIVVSHDFTACNLNAEALNQLPKVHVISGKGGRGTFDIVQGYLDAVEWLRTNDFNFDWLINLSGQDYPVQPLHKVEEFLAKTSCDGFLEFFRVFSEESHWSRREGNSRYFYRYQKFSSPLSERLVKFLNPIKVVNYIQPFFRINLSYSMLGTRINPPFTEDFNCYGGSFFCTLSKKCVNYLYDFYLENPEVVEYYKGVCVSDESFIQTILANNRSLNLQNDPKRYFDFSQTRDGRPHTLTIHDYSSITQSDSHFARKFDITVDKEVLDYLDNKILNVALENSLM